MKCESSLKRLLSMIVVFAMIVTMLPLSIFAADAPAKLYLVPNSNWTQANARFAAYFFGNGETWVSMTDSDGDGIYEVDVPSGYPNVIFCRMNPGSSTNDWNNKWNQTGDLTVPTDGKNLFTVPSGYWDGATTGWGTYTPPVCEHANGHSQEGKCADCGADVAHTPGAEATCVDPQVCTVCGLEINGATGEHKYVDGSCSVCGEAEPKQTFTVYFQNNWLWSDVTIHYWGGAESTSWPGAAMEKVGTSGGYDVYAAEIPADTTGIIFNGIKNDGSGSRDQTPDIKTGIEDGAGWNMGWNNGNQALPFEYDPDAEEEPEVIYTIAGTISPAGWSPENGEQLTDEDGDGVYEYTYTNVAAGSYEFKVTNGGWASSWPGSNYTFTVAESGSSVTVRFTLSTKAVEAVVTTPVKHTITFVGENVTSSAGNEAQVKDGESYTTTLTPAEGYDLPETITVTGAEYTYENGVVTITAVTGDVTITAAGVEQAKYLYLKPNSNWTQANARFAIYYWDDNGSHWADMTDSDGDGIYEVELPEGYSNIIFCRMNPSTTANTWNNKWNQTADLTIPADGKNLFTVPSGSWDGATTTWSVFETDEEEPGDEPDVPAAKDYYLHGWINGADVYGTTHKFTDGKLELTISSDSYVYINDGSVNYMTNGWLGTAVTSATLSDSSKLASGDKLFVAAGTVVFTLTENSDGTLTLSYEKKGAGEPDVPVDNDYYLVGYINNADYNGTDYKFVDGELTVTFSADSYIAVKDQTGAWYNTASYCQATTGTFVKGNPEKMFVPGNVELTFTLVENSNGSLTVSYAEKEEEPANDYYLVGYINNADYNGTDYKFVDGELTVTFSADSYIAVKNQTGAWYNTASYCQATTGTFVKGNPEKMFVPGNVELTFTLVENSDGSLTVSYVEAEEEGGNTEEPEGETHTVTLHFANTQGWGDVALYSWTDSGTLLGEWPGKTVTKDADGFYTYSYKVPHGVEVNFIFNGKGNGQTSDLTLGVVTEDVEKWIRGEEIVDEAFPNKLSSVKLNFDADVIDVVTSTGASTSDFTLVYKGEGEPSVTVTNVTKGDDAYHMLLNTTMQLSEVYKYKVVFDGAEYPIDYTAAYATDRFAAEYTYTAEDLGATWSEGGTTFRVWAPTAEKVVVKFYATGSDAEEGASDLGGYVMNRDVNGTWVVWVDGDQNGVYYTYEVTRDGKTVEACDPYAKTTGVNGERAMVIDMESLNANLDGWLDDTNPNTSTSYTDAVIYELHVRDFSSDDSSGIIEDYQGKFLAFTQEGSTVNGEGNIATGIDYLKSLGVTHVHLLPVYDYGSVDESKLDQLQFNWGYDPVNYNVPEGSYSTDPYSGEVRVEEFKQMVMALHEAGISVIMDVVYNHVYNAGKFCFNQIVPGYFSRPNSNGSGCGNDTASEREMVHKYIVDSVLYWTEEYHVDGFRFDLVGLLDTVTINTLVEEVHKTRPEVIFYGEGWTMGTNVEPGFTMATQQNASKTPYFAYFSDTIRNLLAGDNSATNLGFVSGATGKEGSVIANFLANPGWSNNPTQIVQYASCHDNYTLADKLILSTGALGITDDIISMNNLTAAIYMTAQGIPFIHAGEEMLREKLKENGERDHNSYKSSDAVNAIKWDKLALEEYADTMAYYQGLIDFRQAHAALRMTTHADVEKYIQSAKVGANVVAFLIDGVGTGDDDIFVIFNANANPVSVNLPEGNWNVCVDKEDAGTETLYTAETTVQVSGISAMILTREDEGENEDETQSGGGSDTITVYFSNNKYWTDVKAYYWDNGPQWPGEAMTFVQTNEYGEDIYSITVPADTTGIIFNGSGGQTVDITTLVDGQGYYCTTQDGEGKWEVGTYSFGSSGGATGGFVNDGSYDNGYYLFGWIDRADYACEGTADVLGAYKFDENGDLVVKFEYESYVGVKTVANAARSADDFAWYMTDGWLGNVTSATLYNSNDLGTDANKLMIPGGVEVKLHLEENADGTLTLSYEVLSSNTVEDQTGIQNGLTLHCWNWSFAEIEANMELIASLGFTAIQTSPVQPIKEATTDATDTVEGCWWLYYQPVGFTITNDEGNVLGTKEELESMIETAHQYGVQVIVDVVANHLANHDGDNTLSEAISEDLRMDPDLWHNISINIVDYTDRYQMTQQCMGGLPDLNTGNVKVQSMVLNFLTECIDIGVDGFRFDAAKHIETDSDEVAYESDFWKFVLGTAEGYAIENYGKDIYVYGEVLDSTEGYAISDYTKYMSVTDNSWGNTLRENIASGNAALVPGYDKAAAAELLVIWAESHDTFADGSSSDETEAEINKVWALVAARADAMGLYLARPADVAQLLGVGSVTGWDNDEVKAVNAFHNHFVGKAEKLANEDGISYVVRGNSGVVLVNAAGYAADVEVAALDMADGTYVDQITGNEFTVANGVITGSIGETGIAVVYDPNAVETHTITIVGSEDGTVTSSHETAEEGQTVTITVTPNEGKLVDKVVVTDAEGGSVDVTDNGDGTYSFLQPGSAVTVVVTFKDAPVEDPEDPEETDPEETEPEETDPEETEPEETDPEETDPEETDPEETKPEETEPEDTKPEETKPEETEPEEAEPEEEIPETGETFASVVAALIISAMTIVALPVSKKRF